MKDMISVVNRLTLNGVADCNLFDDVMENHFEKYRYFYDLLSDVDYSQITSLSCSCGEDQQSISIEVDFDKKAHRDKFEKAFNKKIVKSSVFQSTYFAATCADGKKTLNISIENKTISGEDEIYGAGLNTD